MRFMFCVAKINNLGKNNNSQHCWMLRVASVCTPCYMLLHVVGSYCIRLHTTANTDATSHLLGSNNSSIRIKLKSFEKVASLLFSIRSLDSPSVTRIFKHGLPLPRVPPYLYQPPWNPNVTTVRCSLSTCSVRTIDDVIMMTRPFRLRQRTEISEVLRQTGTHDGFKTLIFILIPFYFPQFQFYYNSSL